MDPLIPALVSTVIQTLMSMPSAPPPAAATLSRPIPAEAVRAWMQPPASGAVSMDGSVLALSPGAQIRDAHNRIVVPLAVKEPAAVRYLVDASGAVHRIWILGPGDAERTAR